MDLASLTKLVSGEGWGLLQSLPPYDESASLSLGEGLRLAGFDADLIAAALTQSRLRAKGHEKFREFADGMLFTADGLEQATRLEIPARHAQRFRAAGIAHVVHGAVHRPVAAGHRGQAIAVVPARGDPGRHRGPVDIAGRRSAGVCDLVGPPGQPCRALGLGDRLAGTVLDLSLIHISEPTRQAEISYAVFCLKKKKKK